MKFHNPYNFIPAPPRNADDKLSDKHPPSHDRLHPDRWTGRISVKMTTVTELLVPDAARAEPVPGAPPDHKRFPVRMIGGDPARPYIPPTSIKGMLRSAYEAATNSRFGVFRGHDKPLSLRMEASEGMKMVPVRVAHILGRLHVELLTGSEQPDPEGDGEPSRSHGVATMYGAWLPTYRRGRFTPHMARHEGVYVIGVPPRHAQAVRCIVQLVERYSRPKRRGGDGLFHPRLDFRYWEVRTIASAEHEGTLEFQPLNTPSLPPAVSNLGVLPRKFKQPLDVCREIWGTAVITNQNSENKHDERVFFADKAWDPIPLEPGVIQRWQALIGDYAMGNAAELAERLEAKTADALIPGIGPDPSAQPALSRHIIDPPRELAPGMLCYARLGHDPSSGARTVAALYPVTISRDHHQSAPDELLPESFKPARSIDQLSPAERVFGWVAPHRLPPGEPGAYRGNIRIGYVESCSANPIEHQADPGFPLAILSAPKPQQARFYVACDEVGHAQAHGLDRRRAGYIADGQKHLRGRKVYPHHRDTPSPPAEVRSAGDLRDLAADGLLASRARYPEEARRAGGLRDGQNRSIGSWIARDKVFRFSIDVKNLSDEELGALLWLLDLRSARHPDAVHCHRLAGGKPLGFGSVRIAIERTALRTGRQWRAHYRDLAGPGPTATPGELATCEERFKEAVRSAGRAASFEDVPHITALLKAARGYDDGSPILYPRPSAKPDPDGRNYVWFVGNDARPKWSLPDLDGDDDRLPTLDKWGNATE